MDDRTVKNIRRAVEDFLARNKSRARCDDPRRLFTDMLEHVRAHVNYPAGQPEDEFRMVVAMCRLGPEGPEIPPADMRRDLLGMIRQATPEAQWVERVLEFSIAYGAGWRRQTGGKAWLAQWEQARRVVDQLMGPAVDEVDMWLHHNVVEHRRKEPDEINSDASTLSMYFVSPEKVLQWGRRQCMEIHHDEGNTRLFLARNDTAADPPLAPEPIYESSIPTGARSVHAFQGTADYHVDEQTVRQVSVPGPRIVVLSRDDDTWVSCDNAGRITLKPGQWLAIPGPAEVAIWQCSCGHKDCRDRHRIGSWDPAVSLWAFIASAVKGPDKELKTGSVSKGMYVAMLERGE